MNWVDPWGLSASDGKGNKPTLGSRLKDFGRETVDALQDGVQWVWDNRKPLLEMGLGITMMYGGEGIKRSGQFFGITIATSGSIGTAGLGSPVAVGTGIAVGVSATTVGNAIQTTGAALLAEGSRNLKGNDKKKNKQDIPQSAKDAKKLDDKGADKLAQERGYEDAHELKRGYVKSLKDQTISHYNIYRNQATGEVFMIHNETGLAVPIAE